ncbi:MAG: hypothetical protein IT453_04350 [Planctomycetes bacterium]|nr:hypothetical protein [Planctomycetota bacterium]
MNSLRVRPTTSARASRLRALATFVGCTVAAVACRAPLAVDLESRTATAPSSETRAADSPTPRDDAAAASSASPASGEPAAPSEPAATQVELACPAIPPSVDLRGEFERFGLTPRGQGARPTCSIFAATAAFEFALAELGETARLSPEFVNWAASRAAGSRGDGNFFHNAIAGFERFGASSAELCAYRDAFDPAFEPSSQALADATARLERTGSKLAIHWPVPWVPDRFGLDEPQFAEFKRVLAAGHPIAAGSAHSRLLVGYRDDPASPGGGVFLVLDSALASYAEIDYAFARAQVADAFWVEPLAPGGD